MTVYHLQSRRPPSSPEIAAVQIAPTECVSVHAATAEEVLVPLVELKAAGNDGCLNLTVEQAEALADGLMRAAAVARG